MDFKKLGSINITLLEKEDNIKIEGAEITLYKIANAKEEAHNLIFEYVDELSNCNLSIESLKAEDVSKCITKDITGIKKISEFKDAISSFQGGYYVNEQDALVVRNKFEQLNLIESFVGKDDVEMIKLTDFGKGIMNELNE